jgi:hypothetical protein
MKNFIMHFIVLLIAVSANAQVQFNVNAGVNFSSIKEDDSDGKEKILPGMVAGAHVYIPAGRIGIMTGIDVRQKGKVYESDDDDIFSFKTTFSSLYLEVPAQVQVFFKKGTTGFYALGGGYFGVGVGGKMKVEYENPSTGETEKEDIDIEWGDDYDDDAKPVDAGLSAGLGYQFKKGLVIQTVYNHGLMNISTDDEYNAQHRGLALTIGWRFGLKSSK